MATVEPQKYVIARTVWKISCWSAGVLLNIQTKLYNYSAFITRIFEISGQKITKSRVERASKQV